MQYISIDGDDIGKKITSYYLSNDLEKLREISNKLKCSTENIANFLKEMGFTIVFCAADGVVAYIDKAVDFNLLFKEINSISPTNMTFSMGVGFSLREAYIALLASKSNGKNCMYLYQDIGVVK